MESTFVHVYEMETEKNVLQTSTTEIKSVKEIEVENSLVTSLGLSVPSSTFSSSSSSPSTTPGLVREFDTQTHAVQALDDWKRLLAFLKNHEEKEVALDGRSLDVAQVTAAARYGIPASVTKSQYVLDEIHRSVIFLERELANGRSLYGITTGFGGSADTRTTSIGALQVALLQMQHSGILPAQVDSTKDQDVYDRSIPEQSMIASTSMPESWVRSAMLIRCNSLIRGHSAVRLSVIETLITLLRHNHVPLVPLRGSISASGDLSPLSYIAGLLEGNPDILVWTGEYTRRTLIPADKALSQLGLQPVVFAAKEGLGILNGTAFSAGVATLALQETNGLAILSQVLTAMGVEALLGDIGSFDPFIAQIRPHSGQREVALNISSFLEDSKLVRKDERGEDGELRQDRYALRTSSQWLGPQLEDLRLAHKQLVIELNSSTDNPLIDADAGKVHHGGNFQAASVTSSTEKTRSCLQMMGRMIFAQSSELLDVHLNNGLPPNLAADEPSLSYTLKGVDINMAAYMSELAFVAAPVSTHVHSAEMGNQAINSMALVSARYTHTAVDILSLMCSAHLYSLCQALDLRAMHVQFLQKLKPALEKITIQTIGSFVGYSRLETWNTKLWTAIIKGLEATRTKDSTDRFVAVARMCQSVLFETIDSHENSPYVFNSLMNPLKLIRDWTTMVATTAREIFNQNRTEYLAHPDGKAYLGAASKRMYAFVREELNVPMHRGLVDHPVGGRPKSLTTGSQISIIHQALRSGKLIVPVMECIEDAVKDR